MISRERCGADPGALVLMMVVVVMVVVVVIVVVTVGVRATSLEER